MMNPTIFDPMKKIFVSLLYFSAVAFAKPMIVAHRGGGVDAPENTMGAFEQALKNGVGALELDVQVSKDDVVMVYHPSDLAKNTQGQGKIEDHDVAALKKLDAGYQYTKNNTYPFRSQGHVLPTLEEVLSNFPNTLIIVDMKSTPEERLVNALVRTIPAKDYERLIFYSTNNLHLTLLHKKVPEAKLFESRDITRKRLLGVYTAHQCGEFNSEQWIGFELRRKMKVVESFALGQGETDVELTLWNKDSIRCTRKTHAKSKVVLFGINTLEDYHQAVKLGADAVYTDQPSLFLKP